MKHADDPADLLSEARRRKLTRDEESRLQGLLEQSAEEHMLYRAGLSFDRDSSAREGDDLLVARLANRAAQRFGTPPAAMRRRRRPLVALLVAALVAAGTAAAGTGVVYFVRANPPEETSPSGVRVAPVSPTQKGKAREVPLAPVAAPGPTIAIDTVAPGEVGVPARGIESNRVSSAAAPTSKRDAAEPVALGASALFGEANKKRLAGDTAGAVERYLLIADRYPGSAEANLADLSLGKLFLASGDSKRALTHFRKAGASSALGSEALWGEASALRALGRASDERAVLERLLAQYPNGAYAKAARKRLGTDAP
ncbi:MAG TPA: tetratricopeptide repeat protein [Polyangiaceae bacterium]|nr:tetratricopeptide repeat protein [Polyangiaceae bacterium]